MLIGYLIIGALIGAMCASQVKQNIFAGIIIGMFFGPFAFLILLFGLNLKKCPNCREKIEKKAKVCKHCKTRFVRKKEKTNLQ